jgi:hypothetical protein
MQKEETKLTAATWVPAGVAISIMGGVLVTGIAWGNISNKVEELRVDLSDMRVQVAEIRSLLMNKNTLTKR